MKKRLKDLRRRGLALFLALTLCMSMTLTAFADENETGGAGETSVTVQTEDTGGNDESSTKSDSAGSESQDKGDSTDSSGTSEAQDSKAADSGSQAEEKGQDNGESKTGDSGASGEQEAGAADSGSGSQNEEKSGDNGGSTAGDPTVSVTVNTDTGASESAAQAENAGGNTKDAATTVTDITQDVWNTEGGTGKTETTTSVTTDAEGNVVEETTHVTGSETAKESSGETESEEAGAGNVSVTVKPEGNGEGTADSDAILDSIRPDTSGEGWSQNEDGSFSKTEDTENGQCVTTVTDVKDENGKTIGYTTKTVTTTVETTQTGIEAPEAGTKENEDGSRTTVTVERDENGTVTGYTEVTEVLNGDGVVVSSVTRTVSGSGTSTVTTTTTATKTQTVEPNTSSKAEVEMGKVTEGEKHGALHTEGLKVTDKPTEDNDLINPVDQEGVVKLEDLKDDDLVFVSGIGLVSKYYLTVMSTQNKNGGWQKNILMLPQQYVVKDKDGKEHVVYCADMSVPTENNVKYYLNNTEDADYYTNPNDNKKDPTGGMHLRVIATNGYWGTEKGMGSLTELVNKLLAAKEAGDPALESLNEDQIKNLTAGQALAATQAAIWKYGNSLNKKPMYSGTMMIGASQNSKLDYNEETGIITRTTTEYDKETGKTTVTTKEMKIPLYDGAEITIKRNEETGEIESISYPYYNEKFIKLLPDGWLNNPIHSLVGGSWDESGKVQRTDSEEVQLIEAVYKYLTALEEEENTTTDLIQPSDIVEAVTNVKESVGKDEKDRDVYETDVSFVLTVEQSRLNGDLLVHVYDAETGALITTRRVAGDSSNDDASVGKTQEKVSEDGKSITYTIDGIRLANGQTIKINLVGSQEVKKGAYLITAQSGYKNNQTFVGVEEGSRDVDLNFELTLHVTPGKINSVESKEVESQKTWNEDKSVHYSYYELELPERPRPDPTPPRPNRPSGGSSTPPIRTISNPIVPLTTLPNVEVPLANIPDGAVPLATIMDEDVPLANVPRTGDSSALWAVMAMLSACCLLALGILDKKQREEENS